MSQVFLLFVFMHTRIIAFGDKVKIKKEFFSYIQVFNLGMMSEPEAVATGFGSAGTVYSILIHSIDRDLWSLYFISFPVLTSSFM